MHTIRRFYFSLSHSTTAPGIHFSIMKNKTAVHQFFKLTSHQKKTLYPCHDHFSCFIDHIKIFMDRQKSPNRLMWFLLSFIKLKKKERKRLVMHGPTDPSLHARKILTSLYLIRAVFKFSFAYSQVIQIVCFCFHQTKGRAWNINGLETAFTTQTFTRNACHRVHGIIWKYSYDFIDDWRTYLRTVSSLNKLSLIHL